MNYNTIKDKLCCPFDKSDLILQVVTMSEEPGSVIEGVLTCRHCQRVYPIISGIPIMVPDEFREDSLERPLLEKWSEFIDIKGIDGNRMIDKSVVKE